MEIQESGAFKIQAGTMSKIPGRKGCQFDSMLLGELSNSKGVQDTGGSSAEKSPMVIGTITRQTPTVSHLLYKTSLKGKCWDIVHDKINAEKQFDKIKPGTQIVFDPESREILWGKELEEFRASGRSESEINIKKQDVHRVLSEPGQGNQTAGLSTAVKNFIGRDYENMDCYELVVGGLKNMGVKYQGKGGLGRHLMNQAMEKGLPMNHYLNGEGLVSESGTSVFKKTILNVRNPEAQATTLMGEMEDLLKEGQILSFSMRDKGHTGVISKNSDRWTFINSGHMDHNLTGENGQKKVGEEDLKSELENWLKLARESRQGLKITLGSLNIEKLSMFKPNRFRSKV